jgi:phosphonate transport system substrate-binding protein
VTTGLSFLAALALCSVVTGARAQGEKCQTPQSLRFSTIPAGDLEADLRRYQPLLKRIAELTGKPVSVVRPSSYASVVEGLMGGSIDIARLGPATYVEAREGDERITPFATTENLKGEFQVKGPYYNALLVVLASSRYGDIASLRGARLALTDPASTSGSLLPRQQFTPRLGMPLEKYFATLSFSGSHAKSVLALVRGDVDTAFIASTQLEEAHVGGLLPAGRVRVLWTSAPIPHDPFVYRGQLCEPLRRQIRAAFLDDQATRSLRALLDGFNAARFVAVDDNNYAGIRRLLARPAP